MDTSQLSPLGIGEIFEKLLSVMSRLRGPEGCPWDKKQSHQSLRACLLEETYEVLATIDREDSTALKEELGDLLLQVVFHAQIAHEQKEFEMKEILLLLIEKLVRRHPHVFSDEKAAHPEEALRHWERIKAKEKGGKGHLLSGIPQEFPALLRAYRMGAKASRAGFDWPQAEGVLHKIEEEIRELHQEVAQQNLSGVEEEFGDLLFSLAQLARFLKVNPEDALRKSTQKFQKRFERMEREIQNKGKEFHELSPEEWEALWEQSKSFTESV